MTLATVPAATPVTAYGSTLAWSTFDPATKHYRLTVRYGGRIRITRVTRSEVPFQADLGVDGRGRVTVVYSRCNRSGSGCDLYGLDVKTLRERRLPVSSRSYIDSPAALWRGTLVYFRRGFGKLQLRIADVDGRVSRRVPGVPVTRLDTFDRPAEIDLYGNRLVYNLDTNPPFCPQAPNGGSSSLGDFGFETWTVNIRTHRSRRLSLRCDNHGGPILEDPNLGPRGLLVTNDLSSRADLDPMRPISRVTLSGPVRKTTLYTACNSSGVAQTVDGIVSVDSASSPCSVEGGPWNITLHPR